MQMRRFLSLVLICLLLQLRKHQQQEAAAKKAEAKRIADEEEAALSRPKPKPGKVGGPKVRLVHDEQPCVCLLGAAADLELIACSPPPFTPLSVFYLHFFFFSIRSFHSQSVLFIRR